MKRKINKVFILDVLLIIIILLLYIFVYMYIYNDFRERKRKEISKDIISIIDRKIDINKDKSTSIVEDTVKYNGYNYTVLGKINIKKISLYEPIFKENTKQALDTALVKMYGPDLNNNGNVVIAGHNFMKGNYFIKIQNLVNNDKITITDLYGNNIDYYVYEYKKTSIDDSSYLKTIDKDDKIITLVTCTKGGKERYYVKARVK